MDPLTAIAIIGGGILAVSALKDKKGPSSEPVNASPNVAANAAEMGYDHISQKQYDEQGGVEAGQSATIVSAEGEVVGTVVGTGDGNQIFQESDGTVHIRSSGDDDIEIEPDVMHRTPSGISAVASTKLDPFKPAGVAPPRRIHPLPNRPVSNALFNQRMRNATRKGFVIPH